MVGKCTTNNKEENLKLPFDLFRWQVKDKDAGVTRGKMLSRVALTSVFVVISRTIQVIVCAVLTQF